MTCVQVSAPEPPRLVSIVHADDCGLSEGITNSILKCHDTGWLQRTSIVVTGAAWQYAVSTLRERPHLGVVAHLNLFEGVPLSPAAEVDLLVDRRGRFNRGFLQLWRRTLASRSATRLRSQVRLELRRQLERFGDAFGRAGSVSVDSHLHYHVIPGVFNELLPLCGEFSVHSVRLPRERLYWPSTTGAPRPRVVNVAKNLTLQMLSRRAARLVEEHALQTTDAFVGVLATGEMTLAHVRAALDCLRRRQTPATVEILFHPGRARPEETYLWSDRPHLAEVYRSPARDREAQVLCSAELGHLLQEYASSDAGFDPAAPTR